MRLSLPGLLEVVIAAATATLIGCSKADDPGAPHFSVKPTPLSAAEYRINTVNPYFWLDNRKLLVFGFDHLRPKPTIENNDRYEDSALYIYDTETGEYTKHTILQNRYPQLCYSNGVIWYALEAAARPEQQKTRYKYMAGIFGKEIETEQVFDYFVTKFNPFDCLPPDQSTQIRQEHQGKLHWVIRLKKNDGYIYAGKFKEINKLDPSDEDNPIALYRPGQEPIELPIKAKEMDLAKIHYSEYTKEYVISTAVPPNGSYGLIHWPLDTPVVRYFLSKDGEVRKVELPLSSRSQSVLGGSDNVPYPTKQGLYFQGWGNGSWMYRNQKMYKVSDLSPDPEVSPDGCKIAVSEEIVRIFDFCDPGAKNTYHQRKKAPEYQ